MRSIRPIVCQIFLIMNEKEIISLIALGEIPGLGVIGARNLLNTMGSAVNLFSNLNEIKTLLPGVKNQSIEALNCPEAFERAEKEYKFACENAITCLGINDEAYPSRLRECDDAPILLYYKGTTDLNKAKIVSIVGTRNITEYGIKTCHKFLQELRSYIPDLLIISGLAYGVDIHAHRNALINGLPTIGVLAHGLDRIYPSLHRNTAIEMLQNGGLITEYKSCTNPDRPNFVRRNRIVAGMSDATIVIESAVKGGALITAGIAQTYNRDCFAFPGKTTDEFSQGCNNLIRDNKAALIQNAEDFIKAMCWDLSEKQKLPVQAGLFPDLTDKEEIIVSILQKEGSMQINALVVASNIPVNKLNAILFELEMKGVIRVLAGGVYQLLL